MHQVNEEHAQQILDWIQHRGGIAIWNSANLADPGRTWTTPVNASDGTRNLNRPHWSAGSIIKVITDSAEVEVVVPKEGSRFHVAVRMGANGMALKVTDAGTRRIRRAVALAIQEYGDAWYEFDYGDYRNAVIYVPAEKMTLAEWGRRHGAGQASAAADDH